ncbi:MAG: IS3 family transposase [Bacteroidales bacterium]|nr:IS3 family transposase [Bacteroidales bacterium]
MHPTIQWFREHREEYPYTLNMLYRAIGISKQAVHQHKAAADRKAEELCYVGDIVCQVRAEHPTMGCRDIYYMMRPEGIGRDRFEAVCRELGLASSRARSPFRTTDSRGVTRFENLLEKTTVTSVNQVWQSDITYFEVSGRFYYITFVTDAYSRMIVGHSVSRRLFTEDTVLPALESAVRRRKGVDLEDLIFHSDGGGQYYSRSFLELTRRLHMRNSMCLYSWENGKAERVNGVIKNNYLAHRNIGTYDELVMEVDRAVQLYNNEKPHISLHRLSPAQFEKNISLQRHSPLCQNAQGTDVINQNSIENASSNDYNKTTKLIDKRSTLFRH